MQPLDPWSQLGACLRRKRFQRAKSDFPVSGRARNRAREKKRKERERVRSSGEGKRVVSLAAVFSIVTQRSSPQTAAHIRTTFLSTTLTNHHVVHIFRELGAPTLRDETKNGCEGD